MSSRVQSPHLRRERILAGLIYGRSVTATRSKVVEAARGFLRGQCIRASVEEVEDVLEMRLADLLFPPCDCMFLDDAATPEQREERHIPGPHHVGGCPAWRGVREARNGGAS